MAGADQTVDRTRERRVRTRIRGREHDFFAVTAPGFTQYAETELEAATGIVPESAEKGGIEFRGRLEDMYRVHLLCRTINRVLMRLHSGKAFHFSQLRRVCRGLPWDLYLAGGESLGFHVTSGSSRLYHTARIAEEARIAVEGRLQQYGLRVEFVAENSDPPPQQKVFLRLEADRLQISLDASGEILYRRGFAKHTGRAPLRDTLAAAVLLAAGWPDFDYLLDPMCGSGTFSLAAAQVAAGIPPGLNRSFAFESWPAFSPAAWAYMKKKASAESRSEPCLRVFASDCNRKELAAAESNAEKSGLSGWIDFSCRDFFDSRPPDLSSGRSLLVLNPPYGRRLIAADQKQLFQRIGRKIRRDYPECGYAVIVPGERAEAALDLPFKAKIPFSNGGLKVALLVG